MNKQILVPDSKSQILNGGNQAAEMQEHKRKIEVVSTLYDFLVYGFIMIL